MKELEKRQVSQRIQQVMRRVGITQKGLANYLNISQPAVSLYLQGRIPPADVMIKIARLGDTTVEWILTGKTELSKKVFKIEERKIDYGLEFELYELWGQLPDTIQKAFLNLLKQFVEQLEK